MTRENGAVWFIAKKNKPILEFRRSRFIGRLFIVHFSFVIFVAVLEQDHTT